jgi:tetratricopeptide (TPR) repeat protein
MTDATDIAGTFARGDYHWVAVAAAESDWRKHAALGLCGHVGPALARLAEFDGSEARFYEGVLRWIDMDEAGAIRALEPLDNEWADNLLRLIRKPRISILSQLSWARSLAGPHNNLLVAENDPKFNIRNISFAPADLPNRPDANIHDYYDEAFPPDLYLSEMLEWHVIPPNIQELPCPIIGQTGDYDLHIQTLYPWLQVFDEVMVTDTTEYADVSRLVNVPVTTFSKPVSLAPTRPDPIECEKDLDLVVTGSLFHHYYPDKAEMVRQVLTAENFKPFFYNGFFSFRKYYPLMARSKIAIALPRHLGAIPSRGYEALAMGTVLLTPPESCQRLFTGDDAGVVPFSLANDGLKKAVETVLADFPRYEEGARRGMEIVRREFNPVYASRQYMRMVTFLAARPRPPRRMVAERPVQVRSIAYKGYIQAGGEKTYQTMLTKRLEDWQATPPEQHTLASIALPARELMLEYAYRLLLPKPQSFTPLRDMALQNYRDGLERYPLSLALRFNYVRAAFHFGTPDDVAQALEVTKATLNAGPRALTLQPLDDVMTWDYCQSFFNYRVYLHVVTEALRDGTDRRNELKSLILASLHYYFGRLSGETGHFEKAAALDPAFTAYRLWQAKELMRKGDSDSACAAIPLLSGAVREILYAPEAWSLLSAIKSEHGLEIPDEPELRRLTERMERRTVIDEGYTGIRRGPLFRHQRLSLATNEGYEIRKSSRRTETPRLSVLLADTNGSRYPRLIRRLARQSLDRGQYEIICGDAFEREGPAMMDCADVVFVFGQNEHLYNRNVA